MTTVTPRSTLTAILYQQSGKQYEAALISNIGVFCFGTALGSVIQEQRSLMRQAEYDFIEMKQCDMVNACLALGTTVGCIPMGICMHFFGCRPLMLLQFVPCIIGWTLLIFAETLYMLYLARFLQGVCGAAVCVSVPVYIVEISSLGNRGALGSLFFGALMYGICFSSLMMTFISSSVVNCVNLVLTLFSISVVIVPESPVFYTLRGKYDEAQDSLRWLRHMDFTEREFGVLINVSTDDFFGYSNGYRILFTKEVQRGFCRAIFLLIVYQTCGGLATLNSLHDIMVKLPDMTYKIALGVSVISLICGHLISFMLIDRIGFRLMLLISCSIMTMSAISLGFWFEWVKNRDSGWGAMVNVSLFLVSFSSGIGPISWILHVQLMIEAVRPYGCSMSAMYSWLVVLLIIIWRGFGLDGLHIFYPIIIFSILGYLFVLLFVPETKGLSTIQIQHLLSKYVYDDGSTASSA